MASENTKKVLEKGKKLSEEKKAKDYVKAKAWKSKMDEKYNKKK